MDASTWLIVIGIVLLFFPIPPFGIMLGGVLIAIGVAMKLFD